MIDQNLNNVFEGIGFSFISGKKKLPTTFRKAFVAGKNVKKV